MDTHHPLPLLAGLSPEQFMRRHWQKKPLLVRQAVPGIKPFLSRSELCKLASREGVESRLIVQSPAGWRMKNGPFAPRSLPALDKAVWTLLVQGVDAHNAQANALLGQFRFVPDARLDDLMISFATPGGGVGPHFDSYDVFLLQASGRRCWKISQQKDLTLQPDVPLKILQNFQPEQEFVLDAGDMLYLPPRYAHDGVAQAALGLDGKATECMTYSIGFKAPAQRDLAAELLHRLAEFGEDAAQNEQLRGGPVLYRDPAQAATATPAALPAAMMTFATDAVMAALKDPLAIACALGEVMTELKPSVWFDETTAAWQPPTNDAGIALDAKCRMMYGTDHIFINGESHRAKGADARLLQRLADQRGLSGLELRRASSAALELLADWHAAGWIHGA